MFAKKCVEIDIPDGDNGFLDFIAEIEEDAKSMNSDIEKMTMEMKTMRDDINNCTHEIQNEKKNGGNVTASFVRKKYKKAADYIETFNKQLKNHNITLYSLWLKIEKNTLGLIENNISVRPENKQSMTEYIKALYGMQVAMNSLKEKIQTLKETSLKNIGIERSLNQAIHFLDEDLSSYTDMVEQIVKSIDRIIIKSRVIIGQVKIDS
ncbi:MAG: hypothetical protein LUG66_00505 [Clostridiales bacterium]|nr:hypothetical protein [Clostridiales bacterium]